jgi:predicted porin
MKHSVRVAATLAAALAADAALAQTTAGSVSLYGTVDVALRQARGLKEFAPVDGSVTAVTSGVNNTSVWGMRGSEDLGGGLRAVINLENGYSADTGAAASSTKLFDRQAWVGLQDGWGSLTLGRQRALLGDAISPVDPLGMRLASFNPNINVAALSQHRLGIDYGSAGSTSGSYRLDNSVKLTAKLSDVTLRAMASAGEGNSGRSAGASATYARGDLALSGSYTQFKNLEGRPLDAWVVGGGYRVGPVRITLTYGDNTAETSATAETSNRTLGAGVSYGFAPQFELITAYYRVDRERTGAPDDGFDRFVAFLEYAASKRTRLYAELDATRWKDGYQGAGNQEHATGVSLGVVHNF